MIQTCKKAPFAHLAKAQEAARRLIIGNDCITEAEEETQMALFAIMAAPLIMGNDARNISSARSKATLLNRHAIAVDQDPKGRSGHRISPYSRSDLTTSARNTLSEQP